MSRVLISGASRGIGRAVALACAERGEELILLGRASAAAAETAALLRAQEARFQEYFCDFADRGSVDAALAEMLAQGEAPDVVIHNAGLVKRASVVEQLDADWDEIFEVNLNAPMRITRTLLPQMLARASGRILFVSSISAVLGSRSQGAYNASKAALVAYMRCLAEELSDTGVSTLALLPGSVDTRMLKGSGYQPRMSADDVARSLVFHALEASSAHNGASLEMFGI